MSQALVIFNYKDKRRSISCIASEKMKNICERFASGIQEDMNKLDFIYNGEIIDKNLTYEEQVDEIDRGEYTMSIIVVNRNNKNEEIICPECNEDILIKLEKYRVNMYKCKNNHSCGEIKFEEMIDNEQDIIIKCNICNNNRNEMYKCITCNNNICLSCRENHNNNHIIINYEQRNLICDKHNDFYTKYCNDCNKNICINCEREHHNHNKLYYGDIIPENNNENELKIYINKLKNEINEIIIKLKDIIYNIEIYKYISNNINKSKKRNYQILNNKTEFIKYNNKIINDIKDINNDDNLNNKFKNIMKIYEEMNENFNYIKGEKKKKKEDINRDIRIINSFEESGDKYGAENYKYKNENEIKKCNIKINNKMIQFNYFNKFKEEGNYKIKYIFNENITNMSYMFKGCNALININLSNFNTQNITNMRHLFCNCYSLRNINLSNFNTQNVTDMNSMFCRCRSVTNINLSNFNTQNVTDMSSMFCDCHALRNINLSNFNTQNVTSMAFMFGSCRALTNINLSNFNTQNVTNMSHLFIGCKEIININLSNFNTQNTTDINQMFIGCNALKKENVITNDIKILDLFK